MKVIVDQSQEIRMGSVIIWDPKARSFLRKLPVVIAKRIFAKVNKIANDNITRHLEPLVDIDGYKIRIGDYRLFVNYDNKHDLLTIRAIRHRKNAYKK